MKNFILRMRFPAIVGLMVLALISSFALLAVTHSTATLFGAVFSTALAIIAMAGEYLNKK